MSRTSFNTKGVPGTFAVLIIEHGIVSLCRSYDNNAYGFEVCGVVVLEGGHLVF
jgi:hypothetical protein